MNVTAILQKQNTLLKFKQHKKYNNSHRQPTIKQTTVLANTGQ